MIIFTYDNGWSPPSLCEKRLKKWKKQVMKLKLTLNNIFTTPYWHETMRYQSLCKWHHFDSINVVFGHFSDTSYDSFRVKGSSESSTFLYFPIIRLNMTAKLFLNLNSLCAYKVRNWIILGIFNWSIKKLGSWVIIVQIVQIVQMLAVLFLP